MSTSAENVVKSMVEGFMTGTKFQSKIRQFITASSEETYENIATDIAAIVTSYREKVDIILAEDTDPSDLKSAIKKRDNIINDVSRLCKEILGYSIVCVSRKNGEYKAIPYVPTVKPARAITSAPNPFEAAPLPCDKVHFDPMLHCKMPLTDSGYIDVFRRSEALGSTVPSRLYILPEGRSASPEFICETAAFFGVGLEELAKHIVTVLRKS
jgi:hypothetical protein